MRTYRLVLLLGLFYILQAQTYEDAIRPFWFPNYAGSRAAGFSAELVPSADIRLGFSRNPATLGFITRPQMLFALQSDQAKQQAELQYSLDGTFFYPCSSDNISRKSDVTRFDGFRFLYPLPVYRGSWVIGISYAPISSVLNSYKTKGIVETADGHYQLEQKVYEDGILNALSFATAIEFQQNLMLGLAINRYSGFRDYLTTATDQDIYDRYTYHLFIREEILKPEYRGWNWEAGWIWNRAPILIGARFSSPINLTVNENYRLSEIETLDAGGAVYNADTTSLTYKLHSPWEWTMGLTYEGEQLTIATEIGQCDWRNLQFSSNLYNTDSTRLDPIVNNDIARLLKATWQVGVGLNFALLPWFSLQGGYRIIQRPYRDLPAEQEYLQVISCGIEMALDPQIILGLSYQKTFGKLTNYDTYFQVQSLHNLWRQHWTISMAIIL